MTIPSAPTPTRRLIYVSMARIPTGRAHGLQIMLMCEAFAHTGLPVELVVPDKHNFADKGPFEYYRLPERFSIRRLATPDLGSRTTFLPYLQVVIDVGAFLMRLMSGHVARRGDIVYCRDYPVLFAFSKRRNTIVMEVHDIPRWRRVFLVALRRSSLVVAITKAMKEDLIALGIPAERIVVAPDAVAEDFASTESKEQSRARLGLPLDAKIAMYIGRIDDWKGTDTFFEAASQLPENIMSVVIGGEKEQVTELAPKYPRVRFLGQRPYHELANNQQAADVLVLPNSGKHDISARYTSPLKLFTYMTSGTPIVASDLPSIREILDERSAYFVRPDDAQALATGVLHALSDPKCATYTERAQELVRTHTWEHRAGILIEAIRTIESL